MRLLSAFALYSAAVLCSAQTRVPVVIDTDIGYAMDDTWALRYDVTSRRSVSPVEFAVEVRCSNVFSVMVGSETVKEAVAVFAIMYSKGSV